MTDGASDGARRPELDANLLLRALSEETREGLRSGMELVEHDIKHVLFQQGEPIECVYFPLDGVGSLLSGLPGRAAGRSRDGRP